MKKIIVSVLFTLFLAVTFIDVVVANEMYFKFEGKVTNVYAGSGEYNEIVVGDLVTYIFMVDFDRDGEQTWWDGRIDIMGSPRFYVDFISGSLIENEGWKDIFPERESYILEYNYGYDYSYDRKMSFWGESGWDIIRLDFIQYDLDNGIPLDQSGIRGKEEGTFIKSNGALELVQIYSSLTLVDISNFPPEADTDNDGVPDNTDNCPLIPDPNQDDHDNDGIGDTCDDDIDGDTILNSQDQCIYTALGEIIDLSGCSINDICICESSWKNHGEYMQCVTHASNNFKKTELISKHEKKLIVFEAAESVCGHKNR